MTQQDRSPANRYVEAYNAGLREREAAPRSGSRLKAAFESIARWLGATLKGVPSADNSAPVVSTMLPASAGSKRKPWVVSQLPA